MRKFVRKRLGIGLVVMLGLLAAGCGSLEQKIAKTMAKQTGLGEVLVKDDYKVRGIGLGAAKDDVIKMFGWPLEQVTLDEGLVACHYRTVDFLIMNDRVFTINSRDKERCSDLA